MLNEVLIKITPNKVCDEKWVKGSGRVNLIQPEHICAGDGVPGTCNVSSDWSISVSDIVSTTK